MEGELDIAMDIEDVVNKIKKSELIPKIVLRSMKNGSENRGMVRILDSKEDRERIAEYH